MTPKDIHKIFIPQKFFIFLKTLKGIEIQNFEPQNGASLRMNENIIVPPPSTLSSQIETGRGRPDSNNRKKTLIRAFIVGFFCNYIIFFTVQKGRNIYGGGGGATFYYYYFYFFFWGGGGGGGVGGGTNPYFYRNLYNLWFFGGGGGGGGGVRTTYPSLDSRMGKK